MYLRYILEHFAGGTSVLAHKLKDSLNKKLFICIPVASFTLQSIFMFFPFFSETVSATFFGKSKGMGGGGGRDELLWVDM